MNLISILGRAVVPEKFVIKRQLYRNKHYLETPPDIYNEYGEKYRFAYLEDCRADPYMFVSGRTPRYIFWDRYNKGLNLQVYSHLNMLYPQKRNENTRQYGLLIESEQIAPSDYQIILKREKEVKKLDALFTHSERLLDKYANARFMPGGGVWYGTKLWGGTLNENQYQYKDKLISLVSSTKAMCPLHVFRMEIAQEMISKKIGDVMGTITGKYVSISDSLSNYMYSVAIENNSSNYYFTEKIQNCFASMTIPVYYGCKNLGDYYNLDGVIVIKEPTLECAMKAISKCGIEDYESRIPAILDNYERVQHYLCNEDYLVENYPELFDLD